MMNVISETSYRDLSHASPFFAGTILTSNKVFIKLYYMKKLLYLLAALLMNTIVSWSQNGTRLIGFDAVTSGRGGAATGLFDNPSLMMNNPAGLSFLKSSQADLSFSLMAPKVYFQNKTNITYGKDNLFPLGCISYARKASDKLTWGVGVFTQGGMGADFNLNHELYKDQSGDYVKQPYHSKFAVMQGGGSLAYKLNKQFSVGITANLIYGQVEFQMPMAMPPAMLKGVLNPQTGMTYGDMFAAPNESGGLSYSELVASANMRSLTAFGFNGKIGIAYKPNDRFSFGVNYTLPVDLTYKNGTASMDMTYQMNDAFGKVVAMIMQQYPGMTPQEAQQQAMTQFSQMEIDLSKGASDNYNAQAKFGLPQSLAAGVSFSPMKKLRIAVDGEWINWKNAFDQMDISLTNGTNVNINKMVGTQGNIAMPFPLHWGNTVVIRAGVEYDACKRITVRTGYAYGSNPVPSTTIFPVFPAIVTDHFTAGFSVKLSKAFVVNGAYEYAFDKKEKATSNSLIASEYNNSTSGLENKIFHASLSWLLQ
jgi:long-chain fatty acid transport protein